MSSYSRAMEKTSAPGKRSKLCGNRRIEPELPDVPEAHAKVFACDQPKARKPMLTKSLGKSLKKWFKTWFRDYESNDRILRQAELHNGLEVNRIVISFGL